MNKKKNMTRQLAFVKSLEEAFEIRSIRPDRKSLLVSVGPDGSWWIIEGDSLPVELPSGFHKLGVDYEFVASGKEDWS